MIVSKDIKFDCCHLLSNYEGKCNNLHGHTYHGTITCWGVVKHSTSMLVDYNDIKAVVDKFDHAVVFSGAEYREPFEEVLFRLCEEYEKKKVVLPYGKSTAEGMAQAIAEDLFEKHGNVTKVEVKLSETDGSWAVAIKEEKIEDEDC